MVQIREDEPPTQDPIENANAQLPGEQANLHVPGHRANRHVRRQQANRRVPGQQANVHVPGEQANEREDYMFFLRQQLEDFLPRHDKKQDAFIAKLPNLLFLPDHSTDEVQRIYRELCGKQARLLKIHKERNEITTWLWFFYQQQLPNATLQEAKGKMKKLFAGKQRFYVTSKQIEDALYKLHAITP